jgi:hypothetical protein
MKIIIYAISTILISQSCGHKSDKGTFETKLVDTQSSQFSIKPFKLTVYNTNYSVGYALKYMLTDKYLQITFKGELEGESDSTLFRVALKPSYALHKLSTIDINSLQEYYSNPCIKDGSQLRVKLDRDNESKTIQLSNFYQPDIGLAIRLINNLSPKKYEIWYDKKTLVKDQENCK